MTAQPLGTSATKHPAIPSAGATKNLRAGQGLRSPPVRMSCDPAADAVYIYLTDQTLAPGSDSIPCGPLPPVQASRYR
jgi:hypothetical protein